VGLD